MKGLFLNKMRKTIGILFLTAISFVSFAQTKIHSHNDYNRQRPFFEAYELKADQIEVDIFLVGDSLVVAHSKKQIKIENTLNKLYLMPISSLFKQHKNRCSVDDNYTFSLMIDVKENWEKIKLKEGKTSVLSGVPKSLPSMVKAIRIQEKSKQVGFEWDTTQQVWEKLDEEINELKEATASGDLNHMEDEMGDVLFSMVNLARFLQVNADAALERTNKKFIKRFTLMEAAAKGQGKFLNDLSLMEMDALWNEVKLLP